MAKKNQHGGVRTPGPGKSLGQPKTVDGKPRLVYVSDEDWEYLQQIGKTNGKANASGGIRKAIAAHKRALARAGMLKEKAVAQ